MKTLYIDLDFETASAADLKLMGARAYAAHPTTEILCLLFKSDSEHGHRHWRPNNSANDKSLRDLIADPDAVFVAHNAGFEQAVWECIMVPEFGFPPLPPGRWEDTMATAAWKSIPLALDKGARALGLTQEKDKEGNRLTLGMSRVDKKTGMMPERTPEKLNRIAAYCAQDVAVETALRHRIGLLSEQSPNERKMWLYDQKINQRGVRIDLDFVRQAQLVIDRASTPLLHEFRELTGGVNPGQRDKVIEWCAGQGTQLDNLQKAYLETLLGVDEETDEAGYETNALEDIEDGIVQAPLSEQVRRVLTIRQMLGSTSIKKLARMQSCAGEDGRARGLLQYHAASTGRWGGRILNPQNFPRGALKVSPEQAVEVIMTGDPEFVEAILGLPAIEAVASSLRHALIPDPGKVFLVGDFAGIEARIVLAQAGQHDKVAMMAAGEDVYLDMACAIFGKPAGSYTKADLIERQAGKGGVLGCGFQCGAINFNVKFLGGADLDMAYKTVGTYREVWAPEVPKLWKCLDRAAMRAAKGAPGNDAYGVAYKLEDGWLTARLPSGWQKIWYYAPRLDRDDKFDRECWVYSAFKGGKHTKIKAYGGLLTENAVQGLARGLLCASIDRLERADMPVVLTIHDECVCEVDEGRADLKLFEQTMAAPTRWARDMGIPIAVEAWSGDRYRK